MPLFLLPTHNSPSFLQQSDLFQELVFFFVVFFFFFLIILYKTSISPGRSFVWEASGQLCSLYRMYTNPNL